MGVIFLLSFPVGLVVVEYIYLEKDTRTSIPGTATQIEDQIRARISVSGNSITGQRIFALNSTGYFKLLGTQVESVSRIPSFMAGAGWTITHGGSLGATGVMTNITNTFQLTFVQILGFPPMQSLDITLRKQAFVSGAATGIQFFMD